MKPRLDALDLRVKALEADIAKVILARTPVVASLDIEPQQQEPDE